MAEELKVIKRCAACRKEKPASEMKVCMHAQMHNYVCDSKCMNDFYKPPKKPAQLPSQGGEAVEVVAWQDAENPLHTTSARRVMHEWAGNGYPIVELMTVAQHQRILAASVGSGEPVGVVFTMEALAPGGGVKSHASLNRDLPAGTKLYTHPADQVAEPLKQIAWKRRDGVMGCSRFMTQKRYDAQSPQMKGNYEPFHCAHCNADQVEDDLTMVKVSRELLEQIAVELEHDNDRYFLGRELRALLAKP